MSCGNCTNCSNKCNVCINCDTGPEGPHCDTQQTLCSGSRMKGQLASAYIGAASAPTFVARTDIIFKKMPQAEFNRWITYANNAAKYGKTKPSSTRAVAAETRPFVYADKVNELCTFIKEICSTNTIPPTAVAKETIVSAEYFNTITQTLNNMKVNNGACEVCVSSCNVKCNTCNSCDSCISCNSCQGVSSYSSHYSSHYSSSH